MEPVVVNCLCPNTTMAATLTVAAAPPPALRLSTSMSSSSFRFSARATPPLLKLAVGGATALLSLLSPKKPSTSSRREEDAAPVAPRSTDDVLRILRFDFDRAYFLTATGNFTLDIYAEDCLFEDPTISFRGKDQYSQNLDLLMPFFENPSLRLKTIEKGCTSELNFIVADWKLRTYLKLPWRPLISIGGTTVYDLDKEFKIVRHSESWNISALEAVAQIFTYGSREGGE